ncbi:MAG: hypothetical protein HFH68_12395 [Lachnospiraceae bacterium]|nr:hypothetical protein [Lachnospiraceae bacterium]
MENQYNPRQLIAAYYKFVHGREKADAIRYAIQQADLNNDIPYMIYFRQEFCHEAIWYADKIDIYTVFPELLSLIDRYPDKRPASSRHSDIMEDILYIYGIVALDSSEYYQIPLEECEKFLNDYKKRFIRAGHSASLPYRYMASFYTTTGDTANAARCFDNFMKCQPDNDRCPGCLTNSKIHYYLFNNMKEYADMFAAKIEDGTIRCNGGENNSFSLLRLKVNYIKYYIIHGDYENAAACADIIRHKDSLEKQFNVWHFIMCAYVYSNPGRGMRIYKKYWQEWENERSPYDKFYSYMCAACFFKVLDNQKDKDTVRINAGSSFPLYNGGNTYKISSLMEYYYKGAEEIAKKFDQRNRTSKFMDELKMAFANAR